MQRYGDFCDLTLSVFKDTTALFWRHYKEDLLKIFLIYRIELLNLCEETQKLFKNRALLHYAVAIFTRARVNFDFIALVHK